jgi:aryl-alcohol dehydrogenase-like predicted oxidoreductase
MPVARRMLGALGPLQGALRKAAPKANARLPLTPELLKGSIEESLRRLGSDRIEVYALHAATPEDLARDEVLRALQDVLASGKARAIGVASDAAAAAAALGIGAPFSVVQLPQPAPGALDPVARARGAGFGCVTHSILGETLAVLARRAAGDAALRARVCAASGLEDPEAALAHLLMSRAFALNPEGVVLVSMLSPRSLARNLAAAERPAAGGFEELGL